MLKVFLVDDEFYFRQALKVSLEWEELGFIICGEAENGIEALVKLDTLKPDIVIVDINMPIMNGLDFIRKIAEKGLNIKTIILTGYEEFAYARKAVELGAEKYLLKPVDENELRETVLALKEKILKETGLKHEREFLKNQVRTNLPILKDKLLNDLIHGIPPERYQDVKERAESLQLDITASIYQVIVIEAEDGRPEMWNGDKQLQLFAIGNIALEIVGKIYKCNLCYDGNKSICLIILHSGETTADNLDIQTKRACDRVRAAVSKYLGLETVIGVGDKYASLAGISISFREAQAALGSRLISGEDKSILFSDINNFEIGGNFYTVDQRRQLILSMRVFNTVEMHGLLDSILDQFNGKKVRLETLQNVATEFLSTCVEYLAENKLKFSDVFPEDFNPYESIKQKKSIKELGNWIKEIFAAAVEFVQGKNLIRSSSKIVAKAKSYIDENFNNPELKIDDIANHIHINYNHLCVIFKRECQLTINEYVTEVRMKKSKALIENGYTSIQAIANKVGYEDPKYFSKCFKKVFGVLPSNYIREN